MNLLVRCAGKTLALTWTCRP
ncbi:hypothetical protein [Escherichia coli]|nr:hypothetical protein [Escherichia coli]